MAGVNGGPALRALHVAVARTLALLRGFGIVFQLIAIVGLRGWYFSAAHLTTPLLIAGWGVVFIVVSLRRGLNRTLSSPPGATGSGCRVADGEGC